MANYECNVTIPLLTILDAEERQFRTHWRNNNLITCRQFERFRTLVESYSKRACSRTSKRYDKLTLKRRNEKLKRFFCFLRTIARRRENKNLEIELRLFLRNAECDCCGALKVSFFLERLKQQFSLNSSSLAKFIDYYFEYRYRRNRNDWRRIFFGKRGIFWDDKKPICHSVIAATNHANASLAVALEGERRRISDAVTTNDDVREILSALSSGDDFTTAVCRFTHPLDSRLTITWKEKANSDVPIVNIEYEFDDRGNFRAELIRDFMALFPHNTWSAFDDAVKRKTDLFEQRARPKIYTLSVGERECSESLNEFRRLLLTESKRASRAESKRIHLSKNASSAIRATYSEKLSNVRSQFASYFVRDIMCLKGNMIAKKWNGTQHVLSCGSVKSFGKVHMVVDIFASNKRNGFAFAVKRSSFDDQTLAALSEYFWLAEVLPPNRKDIVKIIIVDCAAAFARRRLNFLERKSILDNTFTAHVLAAFTSATENRLTFIKQHWGRLPANVERAASLLRKCKSPGMAAIFDARRGAFQTPSERASSCGASPAYDGILIYDRRKDICVKVKPFQTVDLYCDIRGVLYTENRVTIAKCSKAMASRIHENRDIGDVQRKGCKAVIAEFVVAMNSTVCKKDSKSGFLEKPLSLRFARVRDDRITANTYLEFCEIVKAVLVGEVVDRFSSTV